MKRLFDILLSCLLLFVFFIPILLVAFIIKITSKGPALFNQDDLVALRTEKGIDSLLPGLTGWAQINGRDELPIPVKVGFDEYYYKNKSFFLDFKILFLTFVKVIRREGVDY